MSAPIAITRKDGFAGAKELGPTHIHVVDSHFVVLKEVERLLRSLSGIYKGDGRSRGMLTGMITRSTFSMPSMVRMSPIWAARTGHC